MTAVWTCATSKSNIRHRSSSFILQKLELCSKWSLLSRAIFSCWISRALWLKLLCCLYFTQSSTFKHDQYSGSSPCQYPQVNYALATSLMSQKHQSLFSQHLALFSEYFISLLLQNAFMSIYIHILAYILSWGFFLSFWSFKHLSLKKSLSSRPSENSDHLELQYSTWKRTKHNITTPHPLYLTTTIQCNVIELSLYRKEKE